MIGITVILASVTGTFVFGLSDQGQSMPPQAQFAFNEPSSANPNNITITHVVGDPIQRSNIEVIATDTEGSGNTDLDCGDTTSGPQFPEEEITAGDQCEVQISTDGNSQDGILYVTWTAEDGSTTSTLSMYDYDF